MRFTPLGAGTLQTTFAPYPGGSPPSFPVRFPGGPVNLPILQSSSTSSLGPGATMPAGSAGTGNPYFNRPHRPWPQQSANDNSASTVQPASAAELAAEQAAAAAAAAPATTPAATTTSWLDENTITASYSNGQVLLAGGAVLALIYLFKRR